jgi:hypothetical protein
MAMPCVRFEVGTDIVILFEAEPSSKDLINRKVITLHGIRCLINAEWNNLLCISFFRKEKKLFFYRYWVTNYVRLFDGIIILFRLSNQ